MGISSKIVINVVNKYLMTRYHFIIKIRFLNFFEDVTFIISINLEEIKLIWVIITDKLHHFVSTIHLVQILNYIYS